MYKLQKFSCLNSVSQKSKIRGSPTHNYQFMKWINEVPAVLIYHFVSIGVISTVLIHRFVWDVQGGAEIVTIVL